MKHKQVPAELDIQSFKPRWLIAYIAFVVIVFAVLTSFMLLNSDASTQIKLWDLMLLFVDMGIMYRVTRLGAHLSGSTVQVNSLFQTQHFPLKSIVSAQVVTGRSGFQHSSYLSLKLKNDPPEEKVWRDINAPTKHRTALVKFCNDLNKRLKTH